MTHPPFFGKKSLPVCVNAVLDGLTQSCHPVHAEVIASGRRGVPGGYNAVVVGRRPNDGEEAIPPASSPVGRPVSCPPPPRHSISIIDRRFPPQTSADPIAASLPPSTRRDFALLL